jgi:hypothetical protein
VDRLKEERGRGGHGAHHNSVEHGRTVLNVLRSCLVRKCFGHTCSRACRALPGDRSRRHSAVGNVLVGPVPAGGADGSRKTWGPCHRVGAGPRAWVKASPRDLGGGLASDPGADVAAFGRASSHGQGVGTGRGSGAKRPEAPSASARSGHKHLPDAYVPYAVAQGVGVGEMHRLRRHPNRIRAAARPSRPQFEPQRDPAGRNSSRSATQRAAIRAAARPSGPQFGPQRNSAGHDASRSPVQHATRPM